MSARRPNETDAATIRKLAVQAEADPRSVRKELDKPGSVRGMAGHRIRAVLAGTGAYEGASGQAS